MYKHPFCVVLAIAAMLLAGSRSDAQYRINDNGEMVNSDPMRLMVQIKLTLAPEVQSVNSDFLQAALHGLQISGYASFESARGGEEITHVVIPLTKPLDNAAEAAKRRDIEDQLNALVKPNLELTSEQR